MRTRVRMPRVLRVLARACACASSAARRAAPPEETPESEVRPGPTTPPRGAPRGLDTPLPQAPAIPQFQGSGCAAGGDLRRSQHGHSRRRRILAAGPLVTRLPLSEAKAFHTFQDHAEQNLGVGGV